jgi:hypothetical protein
MKTRYSAFSGGVVLGFCFYAEKSGAGRYAISRVAIEDYSRWIPLAELSSFHDSTSSDKKRIFAIVSPLIAGKINGKAIRRIIIFDNHPGSLHLVLGPGKDSNDNDTAARWEVRASMICGSILIAIILAALLWLLYQ